jgi:hypothetical protein
MIQRLEEKEVDFDDESDSSYIRLQRYYLLYVCVILIVMQHVKNKIK